MYSISIVFRRSSKRRLTTVVQVVETPVQIVKALIDVGIVLLPRLFGVGKSLLHAPLDTEKAFVYVFLPDVLLVLGHFVAPFSTREFPHDGGAGSPAAPRRTESPTADSCTVE